MAAFFLVPGGDLDALLLSHRKPIVATYGTIFEDSTN